MEPKLGKFVSLLVQTFRQEDITSYFGYELTCNKRKNRPLPKKPPAILRIKKMLKNKLLSSADKAVYKWLNGRIEECGGKWTDIKVKSKGCQSVWDECVFSSGGWKMQPKHHLNICFGRISYIGVWKASPIELLYHEKTQFLKSYLKLISTIF